MSWAHVLTVQRPSTPTNFQFAPVGQWKVTALRTQREKSHYVGSSPTGCPIFSLREQE